MPTKNGTANRFFGQPDVDVVVAGAGFAGLYLLHRLRKMGFSTKVLEAADDVGGTWYWNRYPGARCDIKTIDYSYSFDAELEKEWQWSEKYATQPEILRYLQHVADRFELRTDIEFCRRVESAAWDDDASLWRLRIDSGQEVRCRYYVMATGCLSQPKTLDIEGADRFAGATYFTSRWPHEGVDFTGMRVGVVGTGSSGIQSIPIIAEQAAELTVFQRTPNFSIPAHNGPVAPEDLAALANGREKYREAARRSQAGVPLEPSGQGALQISQEERHALYESLWERGELVPFYLAFNDMYINPAANETLAEFVRNKIRAAVDDPETAEALCPYDHPWGTKRPCLDSNYYQTFNLPHVRLVDLRKTPIARITEQGIDTSAASFGLDALVFATGFDAMTGAIVAVDIAGRQGLQLRDKWAEGPKTYLGLTVAGFPNFFTVTGPGSPSVLSNMTVSIEQHVEWICDCIQHQRREGLETIEATEAAEEGWVQHVNDFGDLTLFPKTKSWYMGANVPGKPRVFLPYIGGVDTYRTVCDEVVQKDYLGFALEGPAESRLNDGVIRPLQPDVSMVLAFLESLEQPPMETMSVAEAREFIVSMAVDRPPGPEVDQIEDGVLPGAAGELAYRLYRPASPGPHPMVVYFHGGGWVLGGHDSDDPFCRDLCVRSEAIVISVDYRHAPEARFPAAPDDGMAALQWIAEYAADLGGIPGQLAVAGWSAGANVAAVVCQMARDTGGPEISGQLLVTPVVDCDFSRSSYIENADGYVLTTPLMQWFWDHYADPAQRLDPKASPLRADNLAHLPPAVVVTCQFDPLRDEGDAYARALAAAGVEVRHLPCRGQIHTSLTAVDMVVSGAAARAQMAAGLQQFIEALVPV
ncbi:MAG: alpha/beta hydrolase fold domain-containing protein [Candidatus Latescibacteria bacterium]|nr:alpha/beta hydrolase fold domain-containing protein [Candidatus Latescibacterota bacterium]